MNVGKLYLNKENYWLLYPSKDIAATATASTATNAAADAHATVAAALVLAAYWSKEYNCNVTYISENSIFCLLEEDGNFLKVLSTNGELGWMIYRKNEAWTKGCIEEVKE